MILVFWGIATLVRVRLIKTIAIVLAALCSGLIVGGISHFHNGWDGDCFEFSEPTVQQSFVTLGVSASSA